MPYAVRVLDRVLDEHFPHVAAIAIEGAKGVGKTATAKRRATTTFDLSQPAQRTLISANVNYIAAVGGPVLIDEWQLVPDVWDRVKHAVDDDRTGGRFLLTGSAALASDIRVHSGAGRIVSLRMRPLSFAERDLQAPTVSLATMLNSSQADICGETDISFATYTDEILRSGFPGLRDLPSRQRTLELNSYLTRSVQHALRENGITVRRQGIMRAWLDAYGAATATTTGYSALLNAATAGEENKPDRQTVAHYRDHLEQIFLLDPLPAWISAFAPLKRATFPPKHHLVDPALAARIAGLSADALVQGRGPTGASTGPGTWLGALFESLVTQSVRVYAEAAFAQVGHLRTKSGAQEVDLIVEGDDRSIVAIEVKLADHVTDRDVRHLNWLRDQLGDRVRDRVVVNTGRQAYRRDRDGVAVIPFALLGP